MNILHTTGNALNATLRTCVWAVLIACYALGIQATLAAVAGDGAKLISPFNLLAVLVGAPTLVGYAGDLWLRNAISTPAQSLEVTLCAAYPVLVLAVAIVYVIARGVA